MVVATETRTIANLKHAQANALVLYLNNKRYHWFTYGPLFRDIHLFFDEMADAAFAEIDPFAERLRMLRSECISTPAEIQLHTTLRIADGKPALRDMLEEALANERKVVAEMRDAALVADDEHDPGTNDVFSSMVQNHEKYVWFIDEFLRGDDQMVS